MHPHYASARSRTTTPLTTPSHAASASPARRGLYAYVGHRVVELLSEQQLVDHAVSVLPQLQSVTSRPHFHGPHWTTLRKKNGVDMFEFDPTAVGPLHRQPPPTPSSSSATTTFASSHGSERLSTRSSTLPHGFQSQYKLPNPGMDMAYAVVAHCELEGSVADVLDALFNDDATDFEASMKALWANKLKRGDLLLSRSVHRRCSPSSTVNAGSSRPDVFMVADMDEHVVPEPGRLAIKTATIGAGLSLKRKQMGAEKLSYSSFTQTSTDGNRAFHVVKTLPRDVHDQIACGKTHVALRDASVDHIAVGYQLTSIDCVLGGARTRLVVCAYASPSAAAATSSMRSSLAHWHPRMDSAGRFSSSSSERFGVNSDVRRIVTMLAKAARDFQQTVRQRRFGHQRFVYFPTDRNSYRSLEPSCVVCLRRFGLFRKDHYCQLCGHLVCRLCSNKQKVEPVAGKTRESRMCFPCVARVDSGAFYEDKLWKNMDRAVVVDSDVISHSISEIESGRSGKLAPVDQHAEDDEPTGQDGFDQSNSSVGSGSTQCSARHEVQVARDLFSPHPLRRASALEALSRLVVEARSSSTADPAVHTPRSAPIAASTPRSAPIVASTPRATHATQSFEPAVVDKCREEKRPAQSTTLAARCVMTHKSDVMQAFSVCFPRANPTASPSFSNVMPLLESTEQLDDFRVKGRASAALAIDTAAFDSICESVGQRLHCSMVYIVVKRRWGKAQVVGMHHANEMGSHLPRHLDLATYCPSGIARGSAMASPLIVSQPTQDTRFRAFPFIHEARIRWFVECPLVDSSANQVIVAASLCVLDTEMRELRLTKQEIKIIKTLGSVASDLLGSIAN